MTKFGQITFIQHLDVIFSNKHHLFKCDIQKQTKQIFRISVHNQSLVFRFSHSNLNM